MNEVENRERAIIHCDMDAFYASVEQLSRPELQGKPVVVGGDPWSRGVVSTCSYEARKFGIKSAMPLAEAYRRCPEAVFVPPDFKKYQAISSHMNRIFNDYSPLIEPLSLDEAFIDVTGSLSLFGPAPLIGQLIKDRIKNELNLTVSVGIAHNKFLAKLASDLSKPNGLLVVDKNRVQQLLDPLDIKRIWGVGQKTALRLYEINVKTVKDLRHLEKDTLLQLFGSLGLQLYYLARGEDYRAVDNSREVKSVGRETTFAVDITTYDTLQKTLLDLSTHVARSLRRKSISGLTVTLKIKYDDFKTITRSKTLDAPTNLHEVIYGEACSLLGGKLTKPVRLIGVTVHNFADKDAKQLTLFGESQIEKERLSHVVDLVKDKFGDKSITLAGLLEPN